MYSTRARAWCTFERKTVHRITKSGLPRIISNISTVLNFFNVPPPRAIIGDVPLLETVPLLFQPHFRGMLPCQIYMSDTHISGFFSLVQIMNLHSVLIMETEHFCLNAAPRCSIIGDVLLLETVLILEIIRYIFFRKNQNVCRRTTQNIDITITTVLPTCSVRFAYLDS